MKMDFKVLEVNVTYKLIPFAKLILMEWLWRVFHQHPNPDIRFLHILLAYYNMISFCGLGGRGHSARHSEMCLVSLPLQHGLQGMLMLRDTVLWAAQTWGSSHNRKRLRSKTIVCSRKSSYSGSHILALMIKPQSETVLQNSATHGSTEVWLFRFGGAQSLQLVSQVLAQLCTWLPKTRTRLELDPGKKFLW